MGDYPKTKDEWWEFVGKYWDQLKSIVLQFYPNQSDFPKDGWPLGRNLHAPQQICNAVIKRFRKEKPVWQDKGSFEEYILNLKETKNAELARIFETAWFGIPESPDSRRIPGFYVFCNLCSESYVLREGNR